MSDKSPQRRVITLPASVLQMLEEAAYMSLVTPTRQAERIVRTKILEKYPPKTAEEMREDGKDARQSFTWRDLYNIFWNRWFPRTEANYKEALNVEPMRSNEDSPQTFTLWLSEYLHRKLQEIGRERGIESQEVAAEMVQCGVEDYVRRYKSPAASAC